MWRGLVDLTRRGYQTLSRTLTRVRKPSPSPRLPTSPAAVTYLPLECVRLTDGVCRTLFEEFATHRDTVRGEEETGWVLLGLREGAQAIVLATLPAGALRDAGPTHVRFNATAQAIGSRIVRQTERRLVMLGIVHTHPGSLRHPSDGDYTGDIELVKNLRGQEGIFGIGTADGARQVALFSEQPRPNVQTMGPLCLSWYSLAHGDANYRPLPVALTIGPDLARPLHSIWPIIEAHATRLERLDRQQSGVTYVVHETEGSRGVEVIIPLAEPHASIRAFVREKEVRYTLIRAGKEFAIDLVDDRVDHGVYLVLAELASEEA